MDEGYMGFHLAQSIDNEMAKLCPQKQPTITMLTQAVVNADDPAFAKPEKLIGEYYTEEEARKFAEETGAQYVNTGEKGWRRIVASPHPAGFCEEETLKTLLEHHDVIIAAGGGGIPVVKDDYGYRGVAAVIDKDFAAAKLAEMLDADTLLILSEADRVSLNAGTADEKNLTEWTTTEAKEQLEQINQPGMRNKVEAAILFAESGMGRKAVIANVHHALEAADGGAGTLIQ